MAAIALPAKTYAEAIPILRAPYTASVVRSRIKAVPKDNGPCTVVLYTTSETVMDRFNIACGEQWGVKFKTLAHRTTTKNNKPVHYMKIRATVTVLGQVFTDLGEATDEGEAQCEFNARAQAFKRAARWAGPGQCLYQGDPIRLLRGPGDHELRTRSGDHKPYIDERSERYILAKYEAWLQRKGIAVYGQPFDHLAALGGEVIVLATRRAKHVEPPPQQATPAVAERALPAADDEQQAPHAIPAAHQHRASSPSKGVAAILAAGRAGGYTDTVAERLIGLVREESRNGLSDAQAECVRDWVGVLAAVKVPEGKILESIGFALENCATREGARVKFAQWVAQRVSAGQREGPQATSTPASQNGLGPQDTDSQPTPEALGSAHDGRDSEHEQALQELDSAIERHEYTERVAARITAFAMGSAPDERVDWSNIPPGTIRGVCELLDSAATLSWSTTRLDEEITRAHNSTQQHTSAGRFGAFAVYLINTAEARAAEAERAEAAQAA